MISLVGFKWCKQTTIMLSIIIDIIISRVVWYVEEIILVHVFIICIKDFAGYLYKGKGGDFAPALIAVS